MSARESLIETTQLLLARQGYEATSPREIQARSGVGQGSFYHHFAGKADLASASLEALGDQMSAEFDRLSDEVGFDQIIAYLEVPRDALAGCRIGRIAMEASIADERLSQPVGAYFAHLREELGAAFDRLDLMVDGGVLADLAIAAVQGGFVLSRATGDPKAMDNATSALISLIQSVLPKEQHQ